MIEYVSFEQFMEVLAHNADNRHDTDIWILHEDGRTEIVPDQPLAPLQNPQTWPKFICRASAINDHVTYDTAKAANPNNDRSAVDGLYASLDHLNWAIGLTMSMANSRVARAASALARALTKTGATR
ncbi:hypothetical protein CH298_02610 [Rhodococcoides fascians]|uniref:hypothetical protein n=1 Tax=Rhodococcoides fascians TaxID=1828 RepID=UPI000B9BE4B5|nr:hypothetical protein [Rhodococcus fascians]OZE92444.1 hypothetical protein CH303_02610 [Rhodococcus fascians]OZF23077.1 hypothetical protein CH298_02610 [Rhodococcus fascians]OZF24791.1 hypothetical protein CH297_02610 [Rhodococcus fascians]OZF72386.1 hypothetical protein CH308_02615 [Rhodococcus fascians]OZF73684.1 hypothetical protein CH307_02610 [Rhodococcus fascians]